MGLSHLSTTRALDQLIDLLLRNLLKVGEERELPEHRREHGVRDEPGRRTSLKEGLETYLRAALQWSLEKEPETAFRLLTRLCQRASEALPELFIFPRFAGISRVAGLGFEPETR